MRFPLFVCVFVYFAALAVRLLAQSPYGNINGLVSDQSDAAIGDAEIVAVNDVTGVQYSSKTNREGMYVLPSLPPGPYRVQVSKIGFKTLIKPDVTLNVQDSLAINFTLLVGALHEIVTVQGGVPLVNTESAAISTVVDQSYVENMPLNGRSFQDLVLLTPGIVTQTPQPPPSGTFALGQSGEFSVNGQRTESNYYTVDGVSANVGAISGSGMIEGAGASGSIAAATALGTTQALVSVDDLQEFRVQSSTYSAQYGRNPGGQFAFETKSGTNQWHGTTYDYLRNGFVDAQDWFNDYFGTSEPALRQNDFGGTLGGPIDVPHLYRGKDKTFFFVSYEGLRLTAPQAATASFVPDLTLRTNSPPPLNQALNAFPAPNGIDDTANGIAEFVGSWSNPASLNSTSVRLDHVVNDKIKVFFRFGDSTSKSSTRGSAANFSSPTMGTTSAYVLRTYTSGVSTVFSSRFSNDLRVNYSSNLTTRSTLINAFGGSVPVNLTQLVGLGPGSQTDILLLYGGYTIEMYSAESSAAQRQWNLVNTADLSMGRHELRFGVDYRRLAPFIIPANPEVAYLYFSKSAVTSDSGSTSANVFAPGYPLYTNFSAFAQDEWRVFPRLTLSLGLRWEVNPAPGVTRGMKPYTIEGSGPETWTLAPQGAPLWATTWYNFAPRLGGAYVLQNSLHWETVARAGGGVFFDTGQQLGSLGFDGVGFNAFLFASGSLSSPVTLPIITRPPAANSANVFAFAPHLQLPYTLQWNASVEQGLGKSQALTTSYVGSRGSRLLHQNLFQPANNPNMNNVFFSENRLTSDYDGLQIQFRRRLSRGLTALASYTWSHCIDYGSSNILFSYQRGNCDFDVRHNVSAAVSGDLPNVGRKPFVKAVLNHWGIDSRFTARTGFPVTLVGNQLLLPNGLVYDSGLNLTPGQAVYLYGTDCASKLQMLGNLAPGRECPGGRAINPSAFVNVSSGLGDAPRNFARGFGAWQEDLALRREFPIHERLKLQFRAEAFNLFNHPNFGSINGRFGQLTFGQATGTLANSLGILSPLYQMGGPRSMQFALKLMF